VTVKQHPFVARVAVMYLVKTNRQASSAQVKLSAIRRLLRATAVTMAKWPVREKWQMHLAKPQD
jgi:hypothetical protein